MQKPDGDWISEEIATFNKGIFRECKKSSANNRINFEPISRDLLEKNNSIKTIFALMMKFLTILKNEFGVGFMESKDKAICDKYKMTKESLVNFMAQIKRSKTNTKIDGQWTTEETKTFTESLIEECKSATDNKNNINFEEIALDLLEINNNDRSINELMYKFNKVLVCAYGEKYITKEKEICKTFCITKETLQNFITTYKKIDLAEYKEKEPIFHTLEDFFDTSKTETELKIEVKTAEPKLSLKSLFGFAPSKPPNFVPMPVTSVVLSEPITTTSLAINKKNDSDDMERQVLRLEINNLTKNLEDAQEKIVGLHIKVDLILHILMKKKKIIT